MSSSRRALLACSRLRVLLRAGFNCAASTRFLDLRECAAYLVRVRAASRSRGAGSRGHRYAGGRTGDPRNQRSRMTAVSPFRPCGRVQSRDAKAVSFRVTIRTTRMRSRRHRVDGVHVRRHQRRAREIQEHRLLRNLRSTPSANRRRLQARVRLRDLRPTTRKPSRANTCAVYVVHVTIRCCLEAARRCVPCAQAARPSARCCRCTVFHWEAFIGAMLSEPLATACSSTAHPSGSGCRRWQALESYAARPTGNVTLIRAPCRRHAGERWFVALATPRDIAVHRSSARRCPLDRARLARQKQQASPDARVSRHRCEGNLRRAAGDREARAGAAEGLLDHESVERRLRCRPLRSVRRSEACCRVTQRAHFASCRVGSEGYGPSLRLWISRDLRRCRRASPCSRRYGSPSRCARGVWASAAALARFASAYSAHVANGWPRWH